MICRFREPVFLEDKIYEFDKEVVEDTIKIIDKIIKKLKKEKPKFFNIRVYKKFRR